MPSAPEHLQSACISLICVPDLDGLLEIPLGHDAWVVGEEPCVMLDFSGADEYVKEAK